MDGWSEVVLRCADRRSRELGGLSDQAFQELLLAVSSDPTSFVKEPDELALRDLTLALERYDADCDNDEFLDDDEFMQARKQRFERLAAACDSILETDPNCLDAELVRALASEPDAEALLDTLSGLWERVAPELETLREHETPAGALGLWDVARARPYLRLRAAIARTCLETTRYSMARDICTELVELSPRDELGARFTWALALARLEDEDGFEALDERFGRSGSAWSHLARTLLMFKLGRMRAATRALRGFVEVCEGGAFALLRPAYVDVYLPDRPQATPGSFDESLMAVHEADPMIVDVPDFIAWAQAQPGIIETARSFGESHGFDW